MVRALARALMPVLVLLPPHAGQAQGVADRTPNLMNTWSPARGVIQLNFTHRFDVSAAPLRKLTNTPSFQVSTGVAGPLGVGFTYGSNSDLVPAFPNEWEWFARWSPLSQERGGALSLALQGGWNIAAESFDAELSGARNFGALRVLVAGRAFHHAFYEDSARFALAGGAALRLSPWLSIAGDYASLLDRRDSERPVWGAGIQLTVPHTPHSLSVHGSNVGTATMEGASRGGQTRWGFEYTVPITLGRYAARRAPTETVTRASPTLDTSSSAMPADYASDTVIVMISKFKYQTGKAKARVGDVVVWRNADQLEHTVTADGGEFESPILKPGEEWSLRLTTSGTYTYHCVPHPFMKASILVQEVKG